jgi:hypothetical protein
MGTPILRNELDKVILLPSSHIYFQKIFATKQKHRNMDYNVHLEEKVERTPLLSKLLRQYT